MKKFENKFRHAWKVNCDMPTTPIVTVVHGFKGTSHQIRFAWKWYGSIGWVRTCDAELKKFALLSL
jgi:hypothetical protein